MPYATIIGCDMCPAVTNDANSFCRIDGQIELRASSDTLERLSLATNGRTSSVLCPKCAEPLIKFQLDLAAKSSGDPEKRLIERLLSALKKAE